MILITIWHYSDIASELAVLKRTEYWGFPTGLNFSLISGLEYLTNVYDLIEVTFGLLFDF